MAECGRVDGVTTFTVACSERDCGPQCALMSGSTPWKSKYHAGSVRKDKDALELQIKCL